MRTLGALEARFADDHIPLALVLGAIGGLTAVRRLLPDDRARASPPPTTPDTDVEAPPSPERFIALLLGVIVTHDRLLALFGPTLAAHTTRDAEAQAGRDAAHRLEGLLR